MSSPIKIYSQFDVVMVPFSFTDSDSTKRIPALVLSAAETFNNLIQKGAMMNTVSILDIDNLSDDQIQPFKLKPVPCIVKHRIAKYLSILNHNHLAVIKSTVIRIRRLFHNVILKAANN
jgi:hypothetical protein